MATFAIQFQMENDDWRMRLYECLPTFMKKKSQPYHRLRLHRGNFILIIWVHQNAPVKR